MNIDKKLMKKANTKNLFIMLKENGKFCVYKCSNVKGVKPERVGAASTMDRLERIIDYQ